MKTSRYTRGWAILHSLPKRMLHCLTITKPDVNTIYQALIFKMPIIIMSKNTNQTSVWPSYSNSTNLEQFDWSKAILERFVYFLFGRIIPTQLIYSDLIGPGQFWNGLYISISPLRRNLGTIFFA